MMTIRVKTEQKDLDACLNMLIFSWHSRITKMRTPWFDICDSKVVWNNFAYQESVLGRVAREAVDYFEDRSFYLPNDQIYDFAKYIGILIIDTPA